MDKGNIRCYYIELARVQCYICVIDFIILQLHVDTQLIVITVLARYPANHDNYRQVVKHPGGIYFLHDP